MVAQYQDTIARLLFEDADEAVTRAALDVIMPVASAVHLIRGEWLLYVVVKRDMLESETFGGSTPCIHVG